MFFGQKLYGGHHDMADRQQRKGSLPPDLGYAAQKETS